MNHPGSGRFLAASYARRPTMSTGSSSPRVRIAAECALRGRHEVVAACVSTLRGDEGELDPSLVVALGGRAALRMLAGDSRADVSLWSRVWAIRGLLWALDPATADDADVVTAVVGALHDPAWRVRERALQVIARQGLDAALADIVVLRDSDPVPRVRAAAERCVQRLTVSS